MQSNPREEAIRAALKEEFKGNEMGFFRRFKKSMLNSSKFFDSIKSEQGIGTPLKFAFVLYAVFTVAFAVVLFLLSPIIMVFLLPFIGQSSVSIALGLASVLVIGIFLFMIISGFAGAGILHVFVKLLRGKGNYTATYKSAVYSQSPIIFMMILGMIPVIGIAFIAVFSIFEAYVLIVGISRLHEMSKKRALAALLIPSIIAIILIAMFAMPLFSTVPA